MTAPDSEPRGALQPVSLHAGSRTTADAPLPRKGLGAAPGVGGHVEPSVGPGSSPAAVRTGRGWLVIRPHARVYRRILCYLVAGLLGAAFFGTAAAFPDVRPRLIPLLGGRVPTWLLVLLAWISLLWLLLWNHGILFGALSVRFDTGTRRMTFGPVWSRRSRHLSEVVAVQLVSDSVFERAARVGSPPPGLRKARRYQINLVLNDPSVPRLNVADPGDRTWGEQAARQLADFLGVPLIHRAGPEGTGERGPGLTP